MVVRLSALRTGRFYPPGNNPGTHFCSRLSRRQGHCAIGRILCQWKIPMTPSGIEPATFLSAAQHLNHWATAVSYYLNRTSKWPGYRLIYKNYINNFVSLTQGPPQIFHFRNSHLYHTCSMSLSEYKYFWTNDTCKAITYNTHNPDDLHIKTQMTM